MRESAIWGAVASSQRMIFLDLLLALTVLCSISCSSSPLQLSTDPVELAQSSSQSEEDVASEETKVVDSVEDNIATEKVPKVRTIDELILFQPSKYPQGNWQPSYLNFQDVYLDSSDETRIHAWYCAVEKPVAVILYLHGNAGNLSDRARLLNYLMKEHQTSVMIVDYRGYGRSEGKPTVQGVIHDAKVARKKLAELASVKETEIVLMGRSLGGAIAIQLAAETSPKGLIVESSFTSLKEIAKHHFPKLAWLVPSDKLHSESAMKENQAPVLISHGDRNRVIPYTMGKRLFASA